MTHFFQLTLRTTDVAAARAFYARLLGEQTLQIVQLHEQAVARGARPHWLGFLHVADVARSAAAFAERGAQPLGPQWINPEGLEAAIVCDPGGAVVALGKPAPSTPSYGPEVLWYSLNTNDVERARANYTELFDFHFHAPQLVSGFRFFPFSLAPDREPVGSIGDVAGRPNVHPHWLFHLRVKALEPAMQIVRDSGGLVLPPLTLSNGARVAICDDPQGAAFALREQSAP